MEEKNNVHSLVADSVQTAQEYLPRLYCGLEKCNHYFQNQKEKEAINLLQEALDGIEWFYVVVSSLEKWPIKDLKREKVIELRQQMDDAIKQLLKAMENDDHFFISEILHYDLLPGINNLYRLLFNKNLKKEG